MGKIHTSSVEYIRDVIIEMKKLLFIFSLLVITSQVKASSPFYDGENDFFPGFRKCVYVSVKGKFVSLRSVANCMDHCLAICSKVDKSYCESNIDRFEKLLVDSRLKYDIGDTIYIKDSTKGVIRRQSYSLKDFSRTFIWKKTPSNIMPHFDKEFSPLRNKSQQLFNIINQWDLEKIYIDKEIDNPFLPGYVQLCYDNSTTTILFRILRHSESDFTVDCILTPWINN